MTKVTSSKERVKILRSVLLYITVCKQRFQYMKTDISFHNSLKSLEEIHVDLSAAVCFLSEALFLACCMLYPYLL